MSIFSSQQDLQI